MGKFISVFAATLQYAFGIYVFKKPDVTGCGPLLASLVVLLALFLVLWSLPLYPRRLRKLIWIGNFLAQYLMAVFMIEYSMGCFWFPLEAAILALLPNIGIALEDTLMYADLACHAPCDIWKWEATGMVVSYLLSFSTLIAAMHATRIINLKLLAWGISPFVSDLGRRIRKFGKNCPVNIGIKMFPLKRNRRPDYCAPEEEDLFEFDPPVAPETTDSESHYNYRH